MIDCHYGCDAHTKFIHQINKCLQHIIFVDTLLDGGHSFRNMIMMEVGEIMKNIEEKREHDMKIVEKIQSDLHSMVSYKS